MKIADATEWKRNGTGKMNVETERKTVVWNTMRYSVKRSTKECLKKFISVFVITNPGPHFIRFSHTTINSTGIFSTTDRSNSTNTVESNGTHVVMTFVPTNRTVNTRNYCYSTYPCIEKYAHYTVGIVRRIRFFWRGTFLYGNLENDKTLWFHNIYT